MTSDVANHGSLPPERFIVEVFSELDPETVKNRWQEVNAILRFSMLSGLHLQPEATLNMLCDFAGDIVAYDRALVYFWEEEEESTQVRITRNVEDCSRDKYVEGNVLNFWAMRHNRPMLVTAGHNPQADAVLQGMHSASALVLPLIVGNRTIGSMQLFSNAPDRFTREDAQLLWILALVAENQITRDYSNEGLVRFAFTDYLTGLKTRGYFEQQLELELKRAERKRSPIALLMIDIDYFKKLNDHYGHHVGDQVLRDVASILMKDMREIDTAARYGGEEFVIILPETSASGAVQVAHRLRRGVAQAKFFAGSPLAVEHLSISIGLAVFPVDAQYKSDLIEFADAALYAAKSAGRNRVVLYSDMEKKRDAS
jgi:diguanylate cyclase (GGDEF)-like protein